MQLTQLPETCSLTNNRDRMSRDKIDVLHLTNIFNFSRRTNGFIEIYVLHTCISSLFRPNTHLVKYIYYLKILWPLQINGYNVVIISQEDFNSKSNCYIN